MIKNNIFSSFGRTLGRILCYILIGLVIAFITGKINVNADTRSNNWVSNIKYLPSNSSVVNWSSPTEFTYFTPASIRASSLFTYETFGDSAREVYNDNDIIYYMDEVVLGSNGRSFGFTTPYRLFKDQYHAITTYICYSGGDMPQVTRIGAGDSYNTAFSGNVKYKSTTRMYLNWIDLAPDNATTLGYTRLYCGSYFSIIQPIENSFTFNLRMDGVSTKHSYFLMGIDALPLADANQVSASQIENIVKNSGLATATSVQEVNTAVQKVQEETKKVNDTISSSDVDDPSNSINSFKDKIAENGVITQLIGLPVTLFTKVLNSVNGTCTSYNLGSLFGTDIVFPCINMFNILGGNLWAVIDVLISGLFVYSISKKFIKVFEHMSSMNEGDVIDD